MFGSPFTRLWTHARGSPADVLDYLATRDTDEQVGEETKAAIEEGLADLRAGRTMTLEEYRRTRGL